MDNILTIIHHLIIKAASIKDIGLLHGKMGIIIVFYELGRKYSNEVYTIMQMSY